MATSIFDNKEIVPNDEDLENVLKNSFILWNELMAYLEKEYGQLKKEWKFYSKKAGWSLRVSNKKRNLLFLIPNDNYFIATVNMGVKVSKIVLDSDISDNTKNLINDATIYGEGLSILMEVRHENDLEDINTILNIRDK